MNRERHEETVPKNTEEILADCLKKQIAPADKVNEIFSRIIPASLQKIRTDITVTAISLALQAQCCDHVFSAVKAQKLILAVPTFVGVQDYMKKLRRYDNISLSDPIQLTRQDCAEEFDAKPVWIITARVKGDAALIAGELEMLFWSSADDLFAEHLVKPGLLSLAEANLMRAAAEFVHTQFAFIDRSAYNRADIFRYMAINADILKLLLEFFSAKFTPGNKYSPECGQAILNKADEAIDCINSGVYYNDVIAKNILLAVKNFLSVILKSNFYSSGKSALAFRLDPAFMDFYGQIDGKYTGAFPADRPYGVFFFYRENALGFQVRFSEIARGGWRTVVPKRSSCKLDEMALFAAANDEIFREVFVLAHTQHWKNKDIYEGGSKMISLINMESGAEFKPLLWTVQRVFCEAFVSLINYDSSNTLRDKAIVDYLGSKEIIEIGPDENMFDDMISWIGQYAVKVGYTLKSGLISGKPDTGINHKEYGVTSFGVYQYLLRTMRELNIADDDEFSVKIAGGPGGDVAGNMMKLLLAKKSDGSPVHPNLKITAITDGPAVIYDPAGIDRQELAKLLLKANLDSFDPEKLQGIGAYMLFSKVQDNGYRLIERKAEGWCESFVDRNEYMSIFHSNLYHYADIFMPCGGRPSTLNINNYTDYMPDGKPSSRAIVEGANSFITPEARIKLQEAHIPIIKDASANKCGVITSSFEILSGLMLEPEEFQADKKILVKELLGKLAHLAQLEADWLFRMHKKSGKYLTDLTEELSQAINAENARIFAELLEDPTKCQTETVLAHLPAILATKYADRLNRLPLEYKLAIASVEEATKKIYNSDL